MGINEMRRGAFFISLLCHVGLLGLFVFTIPARSSTKRPSMIFLGSILKRQDLLIVDSESSPEVGQARRLPLGSGSRLKDPLDTTASKPSFTSSIQKRDKLTLKPKPSANLTEKTSPNQKLPVEMDVPPYTPLKLDLHGQN